VKAGLSIILLSLLLGLCCLAEEVQTITVTGRVVDYQARPVAGAAVVCYERKGSPLSYELLGRAYTTSDGRFSLQVETEGFFTCLVAGKQGKKPSVST